MKIIYLKKILKKFKKDIIFNADIKKKNWFNIGGKAKIFFRPAELKDLIEFLKILGNREKIHVIGAGSNTLITDEIFDGVIIKLGKNFNHLSKLRPDVVISGAAVTDKRLSEFAAENNLSGFEFLSCIPGTVGGGIKMNAGCFGSEIKDILLSIQVIDQLGNVSSIQSDEINFDYRANNLSDDLIFLSASFKGKSKDSKIIFETMKELKIKKDINQPTRVKTSGSTFKNPKNITNKKAWELIKESVPSDIRFGDACISKKHSNFFVNKGNAKFSDMKKLINYVEKCVFNKTGINIEKEIKILEN
ncbi:UDP-N-acetylmuramate dehydrogenase [Candidatus Pelagibacter sp.]|nr:UDP-N-acetylmuramate dehydrogenase [Candidatus Pelagibacter sp.]